MTGTPIRILLVDDHPLVRRGVKNVIADAFAGAVIHEVGTGKAALEAAKAQRWSAVVLDLSLPDGSGLNVLRGLRTMSPRVPVLVLSVHPPEQFARRAVAAGATGYLTKNTADTELVTALKYLLTGAKYFPRGVLEQIALGVHPDREHPHEALSDREYQVLRMIGSGRTVSEIAADLDLSVKTVSTYRARVLEKMNMHSNAELTRYAITQGLVD